MCGWVYTADMYRRSSAGAFLLVWAVIAVTTLITAGAIVEHHDLCFGDAEDDCCSPTCEFCLCCHHGPAMALFDMSIQPQLSPLGDTACSIAIRLLSPEPREILHVPRRYGP